MPDDFVLNVRQIGQYPRKTSTSPADAFLVQVGGVGGAYNWINAPDLVSNALALGGVIHLAPGPSNGVAFNGALLSYSGGQLNFSEAFHAASITTGALAATSMTLNGVPVATQIYADNVGQAAKDFAVAQDNVLRAYVDTQDAGVRSYVDGKITTVNASIATTNANLVAETNARIAQDTLIRNDLNVVDAQLNDAIARATAEFQNIVSSWNGRKGDVVLTLADIVFAGGAPIQNPHFEGAPRANTPWNPTQSDTVLATTEFVQNAICHAFQDVFTKNPFVYSVNGHQGAVVLTTQDINDIYFSSPGTVPRVPIPPADDATNRIATTSYVTDAIASQDLITQADIDASIAALANIYAPLNSPHFVGIPDAPTAPLGTNTPQIATTAFVMQQLASAIAGVATWNGRSGNVVMDAADVTGVGGALLASPAFTGLPTAPTPGAGNNSTRIATTEFVANALLTAGVASWNGRVGVVSMTLADVAGVGTFNNTALTGTPTAPTATAGDASTQLATTAFVQTALNASVTSFNGRIGSVLLLSNDLSAAGGALLASPIFTGDPRAPTPAPGDNDTSIATTAFIAAAATGYAKLAAPNTFTANNFFTGPPVVIGYNDTFGTTIGFQTHVLSQQYSWANSVAGGSWGFAHSRGGGVVGTPGALQAGDQIGALNFSGNDGAAFNFGASLYAAVDGSFSAAQMPTKFVFSTRSVSDVQPIQRIEVAASGAVTVGPQRTATSGAMALVGVTGAGTSFTLEDYQNAAGSPVISMRHSRGGLGAQGVLAVADPLGQIHWMGSDGSGFVSGNAIYSLCEAVPSAAGQMQSYLSFYCNSTGTLSEKMRLRSSGGLLLGGALVGGADPGEGHIVWAGARQRQQSDDATWTTRFISADGTSSCSLYYDTNKDMHFFNNVAGVGFYVGNDNSSWAFRVTANGGCPIRGIKAATAPAAGFVGEYFEQTAGGVTVGTTAMDINSVALQAGDYDIAAHATWGPTTQMVIEMELGTTSGGMTGAPAKYIQTTVLPGGFAANIVPSRVALSGPGTVYLTARAGVAGTNITNSVIIVRRRT